MTALLSIVLAPTFKAINPSGGVFPTNNWWIGIIILAVVFIFCAVFNYFMLKKYQRNADMLKAAQDQSGAKPEPAAPAAAAPAAGEPAAAVPEVQAVSTA